MAENKTIDELMQEEYIPVIYYDILSKKDRFTAEIRELRGCIVSGSSMEVVMDELEVVKRAWFEIALEQGWDIPKPSGK